LHGNASFISGRRGIAPAAFSSQIYWDIGAMAGFAQLGGNVKTGGNFYPIV
jgi:hypothetical protein